MLSELHSESEGITLDVDDWLVEPDELCKEDFLELLDREPVCEIDLLEDIDGLLETLTDLEIIDVPLSLELTDALREVDIDPLILFFEDPVVYNDLLWRGVNDDVIVNVMDALEESLGFDENDASVEYDTDELAELDSEEDCEYHSDNVERDDIDGGLEIVELKVVV